MPYLHVMSLYIRFEVKNALKYLKIKLNFDGKVNLRFLLKLSWDLDFVIQTSFTFTSN